MASTVLTIGRMALEVLVVLWSSRCLRIYTVAFYYVVGAIQRNPLQIIIALTENPPFYAIMDLIAYSYCVET